MEVLSKNRFQFTVNGGENKPEVYGAPLLRLTSNSNYGKEAPHGATNARILRGTRLLCARKGILAWRAKPSLIAAPAILLALAFRCRGQV
jgi:hypothetical protein